MDFSLHLVNLISNDILPSGANIFFASALCSFTSYEPWTNKNIIPAAGRGRKQLCLWTKNYINICWTNRTFFVMKVGNSAWAKTNIPQRHVAFVSYLKHFMRTLAWR